MEKSVTPKLSAFAVLGGDSGVKGSGSRRRLGKRRQLRKKVASIDTEEPEFSEINCRWSGCNQTFATLNDLVKHISDVHNSDPEEIVCRWEDCVGKRYKARYMLQVHMREHTREKPHHCTFEACSESFSRFDDLKTHLNSHSAEKAYTCGFPGCPKTFLKASILVKHRNQCHYNTPVHQDKVAEMSLHSSLGKSSRGKRKRSSVKADPVILEISDDGSETQNGIDSSAPHMDLVNGLTHPNVHDTSFKRLKMPNRKLPCEIENSVTCGNLTADKMFEWLINPIQPESFYKNHWETEPLLISRSNPNYYDGLFSCEDFDRILRENKLDYGTHIDVLKYENGERQYDHTGVKVNPGFVWDAFLKGNSVRHRNPQAYNQSLWKVCSLLQEYFASFVGVNMYLTPAGSQGFPPHYDDIEAFILQIEGTKHWKIYKPKNGKELPRYSSGDFNDEDIGEPYKEIELKAGDMLYFPRGYIHQARAGDQVHSLHLTLSTCQLNTWGDLLQLALPSALNRALENDVSFRNSLPNDFLDCAGSFQSAARPKITSFRRKFKQLASKVLDHLDIEEAANAHAVNFIHGCMPPFLSKAEKACSIHGNSNSWENGKVRELAELQEDSKIRLIRKRSVRLVMEADSTKIYYSYDNSMNHKEEGSTCIEILPEEVDAFKVLLQSHPNFVTVGDLPLSTAELKLQFAEAMYSSGFIMTDLPIGKWDPIDKAASDEDTSDME